MTNSSATERHREAPILPAAPGGVTTLYIQTFLAVLVALGLRLLFVLKFPAPADDSIVYLQLARTWADHHVYGFLLLNGQTLPTDLRAPGYPAFLAGVAALFGRSTRAILLSQVGLDVLTCILTAALAAALAPAGARRRTWIIALWLAATCPFLANYTAVVLTETLVTLLATAAFCCLVMGLKEKDLELSLRDADRRATPFGLALLGAFLTGLATLVRPEMPLIVGVAALFYAARALNSGGVRKAILVMAALGAAFILPLLPWAVRNYVSLGKVQFLASRYALLPDEYAPVGFYRWTGTWLERYRDVYFTVWKLGEVGQPLDINELPASAFDSPEEKARVAQLFSQYDDSSDLDISPEEDRQYAELARERTRRHPFRTYVRVPFERALSMWFTPRTELLDIDGKFWPLREQWQESRVNVLVTGSFAALGYIYVALAGAGVWIAWREGRRVSWGGPATRPEGGDSKTLPNLWGLVFLLSYLVVRTGFLTTVEAPEPRYVVSCYPVVLACIALLWIRNDGREDTN